VLQRARRVSTARRISLALELADSQITRMDELKPRPPGDCQSMIDVRAGVDAIDHALVQLIAQRQGYMDAAARIKPDRDAVRDEARITRVLANVRRHAEEAGLSWDIAEPVWRALVESCIRYEFEEFDRLRAALDGAGQSVNGASSEPH